MALESANKSSLTPFAVPQLDYVKEWKNYIDEELSNCGPYTAKKK